MKPSFALNLSHEGIRLFSRAEGGWRIVGETELDTPELGEMLAYLREKATKGSDAEFSSKLILPSSQILFTSITAPGPSEALRKEQIREGLRDLTPYDPSELTFDWCVSGENVLVAAVALETLQEAETFAVEHGYNPVSFVGDASNSLFVGEPFFGPTQFSKTFLVTNEIVERDDDAFAIVEKAAAPKNKIFSGRLRKSAQRQPQEEFPNSEELPSATPEIEVTEISEEPVSEAAMAFEFPLDDLTSLDANEDVAPNAVSQQVAAVSPPSPPSDTLQLIDPISVTHSEPSKSEPTTVEPELEAFFSQIQSKKPVLDTKPPEIPEHLKKARGTTSVPDSMSTQNKSFSAQRNADSDNAEFVHRPVLPGNPPEGLAARLSPQAANRVAAALASSGQAPDGSGSKSPKDDADSPRSFASKWRRKNTDATTDDLKLSTNSEKAPISVTDPTVISDDPEITPKALIRPVIAPLPEPEGVIPTPVVSESAQSDQSSMEQRRIETNNKSDDLGLPDLNDLGASLGPEAQLARESDFKADSNAIQYSDDETVFGARKNRPRNGKPRNLGLILFATLLLVMGLAVLWSVLTSEPEIVEVVEPEVISNTEIKTAVEEILEVIPAAAQPDADGEPTNILLTKSTEEIDQPAQIAENNPTEPLTLEQAEKTYLSSGIWQRSPDGATVPSINSTDTLYVPSLDPSVDLSDAVALPDTSAIPDDRPLPSQPSPAPAGSVFALGEDGLVVPSANGTINPDGILVIAGAPSKLAAIRPDTEETELAEVSQTDELQKRRPASRPENLAQLHEIALLGGRTRDQLARLRPPVRPISEQIAAQTSPEGAALSTTATKLAISLSPPPKTRPANFASLVKKARVDVKDTVEPQKTVAIRKKPGATASGPKIPTRASVSKEATQKNMIKMRKVSLIGVYGTPSKRSALVRMKNGKIVEVSIGDRVDGGRVAAIGADQVHYIKGGRNILLKMPPRS